MKLLAKSETGTLYDNDDEWVIFDIGCTQRYKKEFFPELFDVMLKYGYKEVDDADTETE